MQPQDPNAAQPQASGSSFQQSQVPISQPQTPSTQPQATIPQPQAPAAVEKRRVHHSYIWLGGLVGIGSVIVILLLSSGSGIASLIQLFTEASKGNVILPFEAFMAVIGVILVVVVIAAIVFGVQALSYKNLWYEVGPEEISVYSGIFVKKRVHVPYQKIQSVDERASLIQRIFGVCNVFIDTAGGASNKAVRIPYLRKRDAEELRYELYARKQYAIQGQMQPQATQPMPQASQPAQPMQGQPSQPMQGQPMQPVQPMQPQAAQPMQMPYPNTQVPAEGNILDLGENAWKAVGDGIFAGGIAQMEAPTFEYRLSNKELFFTGLSNSSGPLLAILALFGIISQAFGIAEFFSSRSEEELIETTGAFFDSASNAFGIGLVILFIAIIIIIAAIVIWGISILGTCLQYGGFHARRRGTRIEVERGLLKHQTDSLDIERVQSVIVKQSFIRRLIGYCELSLGKVSAAHTSDSGKQQSEIEHQGLVIHPFVKLNKVDEILQGLVPECAGAPVPDVHVAPVALRRGLIRRCIWQGAGFWTAICALLVQLTLFVIAQFTSDADFLVFKEIFDSICLGAYAIAAIMFIYEVISTVFWFRESAIGTNMRFLVLKNGGLSRMSVTLPRNKIQFGFTRTNPLQKMARTATVLATTAAGISGTTTSLIDVHEDVAANYLAWIEPKGQNTPLAQPIANGNPALIGQSQS